MQHLIFHHTYTKQHFDSVRTAGHFHILCGAQEKAQDRTLAPSLPPKIFDQATKFRPIE
jgi:hypothetical protein